MGCRIENTMKATAPPMTTSISGSSREVKRDSLACETAEGGEHLLLPPPLELFGSHCGQE